MTYKGEFKFRHSILAEDPTCRIAGCVIPACHAHHIIYKSKWSAEIESRLGVTRDSFSNGIGLCAEHHYKVHNGLGLNGVSGRQFMFDSLKQLISVRGSNEARWVKVLKELEKSLIRKGIL